jgi:hypothetical protein
MKPTCAAAALTCPAGRDFAERLVISDEQRARAILAGAGINL